VSMVPLGSRGRFFYTRTERFRYWRKPPLETGRYDPTGATISELQAAGIEPTEVKVSGRGHFKIYFNLCGQSRFIVCANSPSDWRAEHNNRSLVRRILKQESMELSK
jgi:hypothetical protein